MRELYTTEYVEKYARKKNNYKIFYIILSILFGLSIVGIMVYYALEPYGTNLRTPLLIALILLTVSFITYTFIHFGYTYGTVNKYYNFLVFSACNKRIQSKVTILNVLYETVDKDGLDCYRLIVLEWSDVANDYVERTIYIDCQISVTDLKEGDIVTILSNSNFLLAYKKETA